ncbi:MAG: hypothetical protein Q8Q60_04250 [Candidatus Chromulinivorax sp.]|nr:hypothetical protein [Candidatus Chromulinivorax sp.]
MKKLQTFALLMLLSTGYITHTVPSSQKKNKMSSEQLATELGGTISYSLISSYAQSFSQNIAKLSATSTNEEKQAVAKQARVINQSLRKLNPNSQQQQ